jgi:UDP-3-O-[3-hydroxymyristoyl] glucosamine N-acyltransferase
MRLDELAKEIGADLVGDGSVEVSGVNTLEDAQAGQISFLTNARYTNESATVSIFQKLLELNKA